MGEEASSTVEVRSRDGSIVVRTLVDSGVPVAIRLAGRAARRDSVFLADQILQACRTAARRAAARRRDDWAAAGVPDDLLTRMRLPTDAELADEEFALDLSEDPGP